jgi:hypothetical protein
MGPFIGQEKNEVLCMLPKERKATPLWTYTSCQLCQKIATEKHSSLLVWNFCDGKKFYFVGESSKAFL